MDPRESRLRRVPEEIIALSRKDSMIHQALMYYAIGGTDYVGMLEQLIEGMAERNEKMTVSLLKLMREATPILHVKTD